MRTSVKLPQWGMGMRAGEVLEWYCAVGDQVSEGDDLVEVEAEKVSGVVASPVTGRIAEICAKVGDSVPVRSVLVVIEQ